LAISAAIVGGWRRARWILCLGSGERRWMERRFPGTRSRLLTYLHALGAADRRRMAEVRARRRPPPGPGLRYLWIGRWVPQKGTGRLVRFLVERARERPADRFTLAGGGAAAEREVPSGLRAGDRVTLLPSFERGELPALLEAHDAGLFTSRVEGWGLSLNEMLESGMPVFATEAGAVSDLRPFFPQGLRPFPPPPEPSWEPAEGDLPARGYDHHFTWEAIAARYEREVLAPLAR
jgi:glycosyltransferase involved in cell wall biosynthesis